ncbi:TPR-repeat-containing protein [Corynebacterium kutscheri]|uniref:TPR-repeat-containing protein n=1 Tax=Corynebacterium kutscheri TaxID=35755 RepID=A0A0F6QZG8_9CORY|nr:hypothetical protein [Corynebacterium kutscheri]AKE41147.1 hypothetical protein UL82_04840 [Corynebacterium kutscheri]VEH07056.1 TPR-repeat-containing protein [Corynebacterium kutscheri]VEH09467.1 TPR-repeat-containing protein [Corynebacterium kutscheri]VEH79552.1 TPR-repeat-containing protein [Corynebacterium kutscheri]
MAEEQYRERRNDSRERNNDRGGRRYENRDRKGGYSRDSKRYSDDSQCSGYNRQRWDRRDAGDDRSDNRRGDYDRGQRGRYDDRGERRNDNDRGGRRYEGRGERRYNRDHRLEYNRDDRSERRYDERGEHKDRGNREQRGNSGYNGRKHAQRGGANRDKAAYGPQRSNFREERTKKLSDEPALPADIDVRDLDPMVLQDLRVLSRPNADAVAKHLIMTATWLEEDPALALRHARAAKERAGRVAVVRETCGIAAYHAGEWKEALSELRAARRMSGNSALIAVIADSERGLGRPEKAIEIAREEDFSALSEETRIELAIVVANARRDLNQIDSALSEIEKAKPKRNRRGLSWARLSYAYADLLLAADRTEDARKWFEAAQRQDEDGFLDAEERLAELDASAELNSDAVTDSTMNE